MKKLTKSKIVIALYVVAAIALVYSCYLVGSTISYINEYYDAYGMTAGVGETITYVLQSVYQPLMTAIVIFASGKILNEVRALNPAYYATAEELALAKEEKKLAKATKKEDKKDEPKTEPVVFEEKTDAVEEEKTLAAEEEKKEEEETKKEAKKGKK